MGKSTDYTDDEPYVPDLEGVSDLTDPDDPRKDTRRGKEGARGGWMNESRRRQTGYIGYGKKDCWDNFMDVVSGKKKSKGATEVSVAAQEVIDRAIEELQAEGEVDPKLLRQVVMQGLLEQATSGRPSARGKALQLLGETMGMFKKVSAQIGDGGALRELARIEEQVARLTATQPRTVDAESKAQDAGDFDSLPPQK